MGEMDGHTRSHSAVCAGTETNTILGETEMTLAWYDPTTNRVSTDKNDPLFTPLGQLWPLDVKREWVGLSGKEINHIFAANVGYPERMMKEVENLLKEKNNG